MKTALFLLIAFALASLLGCSAPAVEPDSPVPVETPELTEFQREIKNLKIVDFNYIYVLRRKDGKEMTSEDKAFIRNNRHHATNRSSLSKDEKVVFLGSNFEFEEEAISNLKDRFEFENFSKPPEQIEKEKAEAENPNSNNGNANANAEQNKN